MAGIPVTVYLDRATFNELERMSNTAGVPMRVVIARHLKRITVGVVVPSRHGGARGVSPEVVDQWVEAVRLNVTNTQIAAQWGVSKSLVSRRLRERGILRQRPRATREGGNS